MFYNCHIPLAVLCISATLSYGVPVENGVAAGVINKVGDDILVFRPKVYPYVVFVETIEIVNNEKQTFGCTGVIIGIKSVLTAAHCLYGIVNPTVNVFAGIIDLKWERKKAQKLEVKEFQMHEQYQSKCKLENQCCYQNNDIAIMWMRKNFVFGLYVQPATLNGNLKKPVGEKGWVLGWGRVAGNIRTTMLHKGRVQVVSQVECETHHRLVHVTKNVMCVRSVKKSTITGLGDSGGPLVIGGVVYGILSFTFEKTHCSQEPVDIYTDVARYADWIRKEMGLETRRCQSGPSCTIL